MVYDYEEFTAAASQTVLALPPPIAKVPTAARGKSGTWHTFKRQCIASCLSCLLLLAMGQWWPQGAHFMKDRLVAEEIGPVERAAQVLLIDVISGEPIPETIAAFCQEVIHAQS